MGDILKEIRKLKNSSVKELVDLRIKEFKANSEVFKELCFCILTANSTAERCISVQSEVGNGFLNLSRGGLQKKLELCGARFHTKRAGYIFEARKFKDNLKFDRDWLVENIKGLGMKEASHFLRNIGHLDYGIVDFHSSDLLVKEKLVKRPKDLNKDKYVEIEENLKKISSKASMSLGELDLYLWYMEKGKILK